MKKVTALRIIAEEGKSENWKKHIGEKQCFLRGLQILAKYDDDIMPEFNHDVCWASDFEKTIKNMTEQDVRELAICGWSYDTENEYWSHA